MAFSEPYRREGARLEPAYRTSQDEVPIKDARSPQNAGAFWHPRAPLRGGSAVVDPAARAHRSIAVFNANRWSDA